jgi:hypothetical protein
MSPLRRPMRLAATLAIAMLAGVLSACAPAPTATTTPTASIAMVASEAGAVPAAEAAAAAAPAAEGATVPVPPGQAAAVKPTTPPAADTRAPTDTEAAASPSGMIDDRCQSDADCAVKDVGSCCGYNPRCVAKSSQPDPAAVRARCAAEGRVGTCGFREVAGCQCSQGHCAAVAAPAMEIVR